jgi:glutathione S-transferase
MSVQEAWRFMGVDRSHFSGKLRPALRYKQIHHVEITPDFAEIVRRTGVGFVPVLITPEDEMLQDTTDIIDALEARNSGPELIPPGTDRVICRLFEVYADEFFPIVSMRTRWAYPENEREARRAFAAAIGSVEMADTMADMLSSALPMLGITPTTLPAIDAHLDALIGALCSHFSEHRFVLGDRMSLADCALMGPFYAHLHLDPITRKKLYEEAIEVCMWIERCNRPDPGTMGEWFAGDYPSTLQEVLALIGEDAAPMLLALEHAFEAWAEHNAHPGLEPPRGVGTYTSDLRGTAMESGVRPYAVWKLMRLRDAYLALSEPEQRDCGSMLAASGLEGLVSIECKTRLVKRDFKLVCA